MSESGLNDQLGDNQNGQNAPGDMVSPGARLAACREERGWTVQQVASQLNLATRQIVAIESDDYPALPGMPIVRGFIRAYAKLLKIDAAPLLAGVGGETVLARESITPMTTLATPFSETRLPTMVDRPGLSSKWVVGLLLLVLLGVGIWAAGRSGEFSLLSRSATSKVKTDLSILRRGVMPAAKPDKPTPVTDPDAIVPLAPPASAPAVAPVPAQAPVVNAPVADAPAADIAAANNPAMADKRDVPTSVTAPAATTAMASPAPNAPIAAAEPVGKNALLLKAHEESWIEIRRVRDNSVLLSRVLKAGEAERIDVAEPVSVVIGNAAGIDASLRGEPLEIKGSAHSNVARLTLN